MAAAPTSNRLQNMLQTAVQTIQWTYSLFWQVCPQQGILVWGDGYYNGAIKTRKTVQPMEVTADEASLQRSQQLRELYDSLAAGESNQPPTRRPSAALSPEDLTESEWFYLMCVSFSFPPGVGLPGKAYARRRHIWLNGANEVESKVFSRAILAKSARIQTVLCIPLLGGVVEFGSTKPIAEDIALAHQVKSFFIDHHHYHHHPQPPRPALSEQSTSNPVANSDYSPLSSAIYTTPLDPMITGTEDDEDEEDDEDDDDDDESGPEADMGRSSEGLGGVHEMAAEARELMQLEMSEDIRLGSPEDGSNHLDSESQRLAVSQAGGESAMTWPLVEDPTGNSFLQRPLSEGPAMMEEVTQEDTHYPQTVTTILHHRSSRWSESSSPSMNNYNLSQSSDSAFNRWNNRAAAGRRIEGKSQWLLKCVLFTVPFLHSKYTDDSSPTTTQPETAESRSRKGSTTQEEQLSANHVLAERRRREKLNERFIILRSLVPFVTKMDKASILGDTIEYVKQLRKKIQDLESKNRPGAEEKSGGWKTKAAVDLVPADVQVQVSIIENDALVELQCFHREGLLLDVMVVLRELRLEVTAVQSSLLNKEVFVAELRAKVRVDGKKPSIIEVQKAIHQIIPQC